VLELALDLIGFRWVTSFPAEGAEWLKRALAASPDAPDALRGHAMAVAAFSAYLLNDVELGTRYIEQALPLLESGAGAWEQAHGEFVAGSILSGREHYEEAAARLAKAKQVFEHLGDQHWSANITHALAINAVGLGDIPAAKRYLEASLEFHQVGEDTWMTGLTLGYQAFLAALEGEIELAAPKFEQSAAIWLQYGSTEKLTDWLMRLVLLASHHRTGADLARLVGAAESIRDSQGTFWELPERTYYEQVIHELQERLGNDAYQSAWLLGRTLTPEQACAEGLELLRVLHGSSDP